MKFLKSIWAKWLKIAKPIGNFQAQVILSIFYFLILFPVGILVRLFSDPLNIKTSKRTSFTGWIHKKETINQARKQY